jgi:hypothetical protein
MAKVIIKTVKRKTTISKAAIKKAAKIAYASHNTTNDKSSTTKSGKQVKDAA